MRKGRGDRAAGREPPGIASSPGRSREPVVVQLVFDPQGEVERFVEHSLNRFVATVVVPQRGSPAT